MSERYQLRTFVSALPGRAFPRKYDSANKITTAGRQRFRYHPCWGRVVNHLVALWTASCDGRPCPSANIGANQRDTHTLGRRPLVPTRRPLFEWPPFRRRLLHLPGGLATLTDGPPTGERRSQDRGPAGRETGVMCWNSGMDVWDVARPEWGRTDERVREKLDEHYERKWLLNRHNVRKI